MTRRKLMSLTSRAGNPASAYVKTTAPAYVTYVAYVLMYSAVSGTRANSLKRAKQGSPFANGYGISKYEIRVWRDEITFWGSNSLRACCCQSVPTSQGAACPW